MFVVFVPIIPCLILIPAVIIGVGVVLPLWTVSMVVLSVSWCIVAPLEMAARAAGSEVLTPARRAIQRALHWLTHPTFPERWRKKK